MNQIKAVILLLLSSCQLPSKTIPHNPVSFGKVVDTLDTEIWVVFQDSKMVYWFGSNGRGLYRYDGNELRQITKSDGLIDNSVRRIQEDKHGNLYFETPVGMSRFDGAAFRTLQPVPFGGAGWALHPDDLWFHYSGNAKDIYRYDGKNLYALSLPQQDLKNVLGVTQGLQFTESSYSPYAVFGINKDKAGNLWIGTVLAGAYRYNGHSFLWFGEKELSTLEDGRVPGVRCIIEDKNGDFWLSNIRHRYRLLTDTSYQKLTGIVLSQQDVDIELPYFSSAVLDDAQHLWMITYNEGVWHYDGKTLSQYRIKEDGKDVKLIRIYKDRKGRLWLASENVGVWYYTGTEFVKWKF
jgi:ligand-binding sensor domain-containing protein